jgi:hypothetical protein
MAIGPFASAEIEKFANPSDQGMQLTWWPKVGPIPGWIHDHPASRANGVNIWQVPGQTFSDAPAVMYARAMYKPRMDHPQSLEEFIRDDEAQFRERDSGMKISADTPFAISGVKTLGSYLFTPSGKESWELVVYAEDGEYILVFALSARTHRALEDARSASGTMIHTYHRGG